jgi:hypothetical protein
MKQQAHADIAVRSICKCNGDGTVIHKPSDTRQHAPLASGPDCQSCDAGSHVILWGHAWGWQAVWGGNGET